MNFRLLSLTFWSLSLASMSEMAAIAQTSEPVARQEAVDLVRSAVGLRPEQFLDLKRDEGLEELFIVSAGRRIPLVFIFKLNNAGYEVKAEKIIQHFSTDAELLYIVAISSADGSAYRIRGFPDSLTEFGKLMAAAKVKVSSPYQAEAVSDFYREVNPQRTSITPIPSLIDLKQDAERQCQTSSFDAGEKDFDAWWKHGKPLYAGLPFGQTAKPSGSGYIVEWTALSSPGPGLCGGAPLRARLEVSSDGQVGKLSFSPYGGSAGVSHKPDHAQSTSPP